ncbi:MAG TPA: hypothetical protein VFG50_02115 [Rhodothermales bacterium]|nr:hypothetical protein [Rhodothermales bacterium]
MRAIMLRGSPPFLFLLLLPLAGCQIFGNLDAGDDTTEKTYPGAEDLPLVSVQALNTTAPVPGSYNVRAYVTGLFICPPNMECFAPDHMLIADQLHVSDSDEVISPAAYPLTQFEVGAHYLMSLEADTADVRYPSTEKPVRVFRLLGYDRIP